MSQSVLNVLLQQSGLTTGLLTTHPALSRSLALFLQALLL